MIITWRHKIEPREKCAVAVEVEMEMEMWNSFSFSAGRKLQRGGSGGGHSKYEMENVWIFYLLSAKLHFAPHPEPSEAHVAAATTTASRRVNVNLVNATKGEKAKQFHWALLG